MSESEIGAFIASIQNTLEKNGFPDKKVSLPLEKMYETAHQKGTNFNKVLEFLKEKGIYHTKTDEKIIFSSINPDQPMTSPSPGLGGFDFSNLKDMDMGQMMQAAMKAMQGMDPSQLEMIKNQISNMSPDQIDSMTGMLQGLTPEQREEIAKKAKSGEFKL